jgi:hypothetical protein
MVRFNIIGGAHTAEGQAMSRRRVGGPVRDEPQSAINLPAILH